MVRFINASVFIGAVIILLFAAGSVFASEPAASVSQEHTVESPDGRVHVKCKMLEGTLNYSVWRDYSGDRSTCLIDWSPLGLQLEGDENAYVFDSPDYFQLIQGASCDEEWTPVFDRASSIRNQYNEAFVHSDMDAPSHVCIVMLIRVYNDGVAIRYHLLSGTKRTLRVEADLTEFRFAKDYTTWNYAGERTPAGPNLLSELRGTVRPPVTIVTDDDCSMALLEAALFDFDDMDLKPTTPGGTSLSVEISPCEAVLSKIVLEVDVEVAGFLTPWRVLQIGETPGDLIESNILVNLNPPCEIEDTSWIEPGFCLWDWRNVGSTTPDGFTYDAGMPSWRRLVDFASENNIRYVLLDANWYGDEFNASSNPMTPKSGAEIPDLIAYANGKGVGILLYFNHAATQNYDLAETLATYHEWGAAGLKYGFLRGLQGQAKVRETRRIVELCAENELLVDFHDGPVPPSGDRRTWPNLITREFCHAQSDAKRAFDPTCFTTSVFVNMLAGPLDMTNGLYDLNRAYEQRPKVFAEVYTTVVGETARPLITFTGLNVLHDHGDAYAAKDDLFEFLREMPMRWDETRILHGEIGQCITTARRSGDAWFIGSATNEEARTLSIPLEFLQEGVTYTATLYEDASDAHYRTNREAYQVSTIEVHRGDVIEAAMAPGGGHAIWVRPVE
jgi:hypothetical protein